MGEPLELNYAPGNAARRRRWRRLAYLLAVLSVASVAWYQRTKIQAWGHERYVAYCKWQVDRYAPPADRLMYTEHSDEVARLLKTGDFFVPERPAYKKFPAAARRIAEVENYTAAAQTNYQRSFYRQDPLVFLANIPLGDGVTRFTTVQLGRDPEISFLYVHWSIVGGYLGDWGGHISFELSRQGAPLKIDKSFRMYAGQHDTKDQSRFTICYDYDDISGEFVVEMRGTKINVSATGGLEVRAIEDK